MDDLDHDLDTFDRAQLVAEASLDRQLADAPRSNAELEPDAEPR